MRNRLKLAGRVLKRETQVCRLILVDPRTPCAAKWLLLAALGYACMPFDLIPDFIPVIGHLDDAILVSGLVATAIWLTPAVVFADARAKSRNEAGAPTIPQKDYDTSGRAS